MWITGALIMSVELCWLTPAEILAPDLEESGYMTWYFFPKLSRSREEQKTRKALVTQEPRNSEPSGWWLCTSCTKNSFFSRKKSILALFHPSRASPAHCGYEPTRAFVPEQLMGFGKSKTLANQRRWKGFPRNLSNTSVQGLCPWTTTLFSSFFSN